MPKPVAALMIHRYFLILFFSFLHFCFLTAQEEQTVPFSHSDQEMGLPYIQNYYPDDYGAFVQNWGAVQDSLDIMYFANADGVLSYNGIDWNLLELPGKVSVVSLALSNEKSIYVGGIDELGFLNTDINGQLSYSSLLSKLPKKNHDFSIIRTVCSTKEGVFFSSKKYVFKWDGTKFETWNISGDGKLFSANNTLFKRANNKGLMQFKNNQFELVPQGDLFSDKSIYSIIPFNEKELLIATKDELFIFNGKTFREFITNVPEFFKDNSIHTGLALNTETFVFGSLKKGLLILDRNGRKKVIISKKEALLSNSVNGLFQDRSGVLWASLNEGISKIEYPSPFSFFNKNNNIPNWIIDFERYQGKLFVGTIDGLYYLKNESNSNTNIFEQVGNLGLVFNIIIYNDKLLVGSRTGLYEINKKGVLKKIVDLSTVSALHVSKIDSNRVFIGTPAGLTSMYFKNNLWTIENKFEGINIHVSKILESSNGDIWLDVNKNQVIRVSFDDINDDKTLSNPVIKTFLIEDGVPDNIGRLYLIENQLYIESANEMYLFNPITEHFSLDKKLVEKLGVENRNVKVHAVDEHGNIWLFEYDEKKKNMLEQLVASVKKDGTYTIEELNEERVIALKKYVVFPELNDSIVWYSAKEGIIRHNLKEKANATISSRAIIANVLWKNDSLLFGGYESSIVHQLPFINNQLRFKYASPSYYDESQNQFQVYLEGFDEDWSSWTSETQKDYTNIPEGDYSFKVRSKNIFHHIGKEDSYVFSILPPWYRTWWMYLIYALLGITVFMGVSQYRSKELLRKNEKLEDVVKERTTEIEQKNELLNQQTEKLVQLNDARTQLYANITHEFRTPLTVILGMADTLESKKLSGVEKSVEMIKRNGKKLLQLVNEMLDLAKLESGTMELHLVQTNIVPFVKYLSESFHSLAETKKINLTVYSEIEVLEMDFDANKMSSIISNLLSNAIKFTPEHGKIVVHLNKINEKDSEYFVIKIKDSGIGIAEQEMHNLFNRFFQVDNSSTRQGEGTGIGLSLVKEFTELMNGTIGVESTPKKGSTFTIKIPVTHVAVKTTEAKIKIEAPLVVSNTENDIDKPILNGDTELPLVLIIEDNEDVAYYLKASLRGKYQTIHAVNGSIGIEMALKNIPDIIISDVMMPGKDGFEVCATLKSNELTDHIPIIMLTAKATIKDRLTGLSHGADAYLAKPFVKAELFTRLDQLVSLRKKLLSKFQNNGFDQLLKKREVTPETKFLQKAIQLIHENISDSDFGTVQLAFKLHLSDSQVYRKLKAITDKSTAVFIRSIRLQRGKELIQSTDKTVSEVAYEVGFNDPSWFSKAFKEEFGYAPSEV